MPDLSKSKKVIPSNTNETNEIANIFHTTTAEVLDDVSLFHPDFDDDNSNDNQPQSYKINIDNSTTNQINTHIDTLSNIQHHKSKFTSKNNSTKNVINYNMIENNSMLHSQTSHNKNINYEQSSIASIGPTKKHMPSNTTLIQRRKVHVLNQNLNENNSIINSEFNHQEESSEEEMAEETFINLFTKNHDDIDVNQCSSDIKEYIDSENEVHLNWGNPPDDDTIMER